MKKIKPSERLIGMLALIIPTLIVVGILRWIFPDSVPLTLSEFIYLPSDWSLVLRAGIPLFVWGFALNCVVMYIIPRYRLEETTSDGILNSLIAGTTEEIYFRFLLFFIIMYTIQFGNFLFFGWLGFGITEWFTIHISGPFTNFVSFGILSPMFNTELFPWFVAGAIMYSNGKFREGHQYQGPIGIINAWYAGILLFAVMFNYGIIAAMVVHVLFDIMVDLMRFVAYQLKGL